MMKANDEELGWHGNSFVKAGRTVSPRRRGRFIHSAAGSVLMHAHDVSIIRTAAS
jgi:hypothetical protein